MFNRVFGKLFCLLDNVEKYCEVREATDGINRNIC
jgi:hypothetical protein